MINKLVTHKKKKSNIIVLLGTTKPNTKVIINHFFSV